VYNRYILLLAYKASIAGTSDQKKQFRQFIFAKSILLRKRTAGAVFYTSVELLTIFLTASENLSA